MICKSCIEASDNNVHGEAGHKEYGCPALNGRGKTWCDCQHRTGNTNVARTPVRNDNDMMKRKEE